MGAADSAVSRERFLLEETGQPALALQVQRPASFVSGAPGKEDLRIERATHLMHLELQRTVLHDRVNRFLERVAQ